jgi:hypothetical protein
MEGVELKIGRIKRPISGPIMKEEDEKDNKNKQKDEGKELRGRSRILGSIFSSSGVFRPSTCPAYFRFPLLLVSSSLGSFPSTLVSTSSTLSPFSPPAIQPHSFRPPSLNESLNQKI